MLTLAYGGFESTQYGEMFFETLPFMVRLLVPVLISYALASAVIERCKRRWLGLAVYALGIALLAPSLGVMGAWGPAHVGLGAGVWSIPLFGTALVGKLAALARWSRHPAIPPASL